MPESPLKLRISCTGARPFGLDGLVDDPSLWDALAGEDSPSDNDDTAPDQQTTEPSSQLAGSSEQAASTAPAAYEFDSSILGPGNEVYLEDLSPHLLYLSFH